MKSFKLQHKTRYAVSLVALCLASVVHAAPPLPDFVITEVSCPAEIVEGMDMTVYVTVENRGAIAGDAKYVDVLWNNHTNGLPQVGEVGEAWEPVGVLQPGGSRTLALSPVKAKLGTNSICAIVEFENRVPETFNTNNHYCVEYNAVTVPTNVVPVHRFWSDQFGAHFYIMGDSERDRIAAKYLGIWNYEAVAWHAYPTREVGTMPVHRFWSDQFGSHFYIIGDSERDRIAAKYPGIWSYETVAWYAYPTQVAGSEPVHRFWSDQFGTHFYIMTDSERDRIAAKYLGLWNYEAVAYYAFDASLGGSSTGALGGVGASGVSSLSAMPRMDETAGPRSATPALARSIGMDGGAPVSHHPSNAAIKAFSGTSKGESVVFPVLLSDASVSAYMYDAALDAWTNLLSDAASPTNIVISGVEPGRDYLLEVWMEDPYGGKLMSDHASWFERSLDAPESLDGDKAVASGTSDGVGLPVERVRMPESGEPLTVKLYSVSKGVVQTLEDVVGGEIVELQIADWNTWHWVGVWRDSDGRLVFSLWLRHGLME